MSMGTLVSRVLGLVRDILIANFFTRTQTDIFFVAFRFPNFFRRFIGESSFSASVTPVLSETLEKDKTFKRAKACSSSLFTLLLIIASFITFLGLVFMPNIMNMFFGSSVYGSIPGKLEQTIRIGRLVFFYLFLVSTYSYLMSVAQALGRFFLPALAPALFNLSLIVFSLIPAEMWPFHALSLGWGVIVGGILQLLLVVFLLFKLDFMPTWSLQFKNEDVSSALRRFTPSVLALSGLACIGLINLYFAGGLPEGSHTYIYYGDRLLELPRSLIAVSLGTALLPALSRLHVLNKKDELFKTAKQYLDFLIFLTLPCSLVLFFLSYPVVELLFQRGQFDELATAQTAKVVQIYALVLIFSSFARVLSSCFFSINKNWECAVSTLFYICFHMLAAGFLTYQHGFIGLIWSTALSSFAYAAFLAISLFFLIGHVPFDLNSLKKIILLIPSCVVFVLILLSYPYVLDFTSSSFVSLSLVLTLSGVGYLGINWMLGSSSVRQFLRLFL